MMNDLYLPVNVAGVEFKNPFYVASGPTTNSVKQLKRIEETGWAAASIKLTIDPVPYINRVPRYSLFKDRNALAFTAEKRLTFEQGLKLVDDAKKVLNDLILFANITYAGEEGVEGWVNMAKKFEEVGVDIVELNMCCPNMSFNVELSGAENKSGKKTGASLGQNQDAVSEIVRAIKEEIKIPLFVKLTPEGGKIANVAKALYAAGADAVGGTSNRLAIPPINLKDPKKAVYHLQDEISMSCYCGPWVKPLALRDTYEIRKANGPEPRIMMAGGVKNYVDAAEMIMSGADLVGICSETLYSGFGFIEGLIKDLKNFIKENNYNAVGEMRDLIVSEVRSAPELTLYNGHAQIINPDLAGPCKAACPNSVPAQAYVRMVSEGRFREAYDLIMSKSPLQSVCGIVCNKECEKACTRNETGEQVKIREIKRFVIEYAKQQGWTYETFDVAENNKKVAIVGAGPSGLSCAWNLRKAGYDVTVFEREKLCGGMLRYGIPSFRFDKSILDEEIELMETVGIKFETGKALGKDFTVDSLKKDGFDSVYLAVGTWKGRSAGIPGEDAQGVYDALKFLRKVNDGEKPEIGDTVVVVGGGFTAADAARAARRLGAGQVYIAYRRTRDQMPITDEELFETEEEGIKIMYLVAPEMIEVKDGKVAGIKMNTNVLGDVDASGRRCPINVQDCSDFTLRCDNVIMALGQKDDGSMGNIKVDHETLSTGMEGVYAGGDSTGAGTVIKAIAMGRKAAAAIDKQLLGDEATMEYIDKLESVDKYDVLERSGYKRNINRFDIYARTAIERIGDFETFTRTLTEEEAVKEATKCLRCGCGEGCSICADICKEFAIHLDGADRWVVNVDECVACGMCYNRCPNHNIEMINLGLLDDNRQKVGSASSCDRGPTPVCDVH